MPEFGASHTFLHASHDQKLQDYRIIPTSTDVETHTTNTLPSKFW